jgi:4-amino-4-deoxy-L-arabinose transferase-like glycosyltransferase
MTQRLFWWWAVAALAVFSYLYSLDGMHIPATGDEGPYLQITRLTAATGHWLPLQPVEGLGVTKPPLLFWQGMVASNWGQDWNLWRLRLPIVAYSFLTALMVFWVTRRISGNNESAAIGGLAFLGFTSVFQHGRPFITNLPEVFFLSLAYFLLVLYRNRSFSRTYTFWIALGVLVGLAAWVRSIFMLAPVGLAFLVFLLWQRRWQIGDFLRLDALRLSAFTVTVLAVFGLWFVLDPNPQAIVREFLLGENVAKLKTDGYWNNFFSGSYPVFPVWFGNFLNAGFLALPLTYVAISSLKNRHKLAYEERALWIWVLAFIVVFTVPAQRQESYIMATMPAIAVFLGLHWKDIPRAWFYLFTLPLLALLCGLVYLMIPIARQVLPDGAYAPWHYLAPFGGVALAVLALLYNKWAKQLFLPLIFLAFLSFASVLAPLEGPLGRYSADTIHAVAGKTVYVSSNFRAQYERYRFLLPGAEIRSYEQGDIATRDRLLSTGELVVVDVAPGNSEFSPYSVLGSRLTVRSRLPHEDVDKVLYEHRMELLFRRELLVQQRRKT